MDRVFHQMSEMYDYLENKNCLCPFGDATATHNSWFDWYRDIFRKNSDSAEENQILCIRIIGLTCEICVKCVSSNQFVCNDVNKFLQLLGSDQIWDDLIYLLRFTSNKYLTWCVIKSLTTLVYAFGEPYLDHIQALLAGLNGNIFQDENLNIINFLSGVVTHQPVLENCEENLHVCSNASSICIHPFCDIFTSISSILLNSWNRLLDNFHQLSSSGASTKDSAPFLFLWQNLIQKLNKNLDVLVNEKCVVMFFSNAQFFPPVMLQIYADIIMQFFIQNVASQLTEKESISSVSEVVHNSLNKGFLDRLACSDQQSNFCVSKKRLERADSVASTKCDLVVARKISFICLNGLIGMEDILKLYNALSKVFTFMKQNFDLPLNTPTHTCILQIFIDQDDLLFGVMLALLQLYSIFKKNENFSDSSNAVDWDAKSELNPHMLFISFLIQIGFDHSELLSFLTSDETCFLLYLLQYLKLLIGEKDRFLQAHQSLLSAESEFSTVKAKDFKLDTERDQNLVGYSSSSDEESEIIPSVVPENCDINFKELKSVRMLSQLRQAIQKLVDANEFPYAVSPLLSLLSTCDNL